MTRWRPALRMARRDLWRHKGRTLLTMLLVALPVLVGVAAAQFHHNTRWEGERAARMTMGAADALVEVTPFARTRVRYWPNDMTFVSADFTRTEGARRAVRRDPSTVELAALLPSGSRVTQATRYVDVALATGGVGHARLLDASDPRTVGLADVSSGTEPALPDEVALNRTAADELGLLDADGRPQAEAALELLDGTRLNVVGVLDDNDDTGYGNGVELLAPPDSVLSRVALTVAGPSRRYLVDLPESVGPAPHALAESLASHGVAMLPRDMMFHPAAWQVQAAPGPVDAGSLAIGALVVLFGLVEVVLIVGSTFAIGARRQVRDLGLMAASGGAPADVRRVLLAQGLVLGAIASVLGALAGLLAFRAGAPMYEELTHQPIWTYGLDWLAVLGVTALGSFTGLAAAFVPARSIGRLTPVAALAGRFPIRSGESRAHRPAFALMGVGLLVLVLSGWWISVEYAPPADAPGRESFATPSAVPVVIGALGLLLLLGGTAWAAPYAVRRLAALGRWLPLSGRFAFRDAARHRFRTGAAAVTLMVTVAGTIFAGFVVQAVATDLTGNIEGREHHISIYLDSYESAGQPSSALVPKVTDTVHEIVGPAETLAASRVTRAKTSYPELAISGRGGAYEPVRVVDESTLSKLVGQDARLLDAFRDGAFVTTAAQKVHDGSVTVSFSPGRRKPANRWSVPAVVAKQVDTNVPDLFGTWVSEETVRRMGLVAVPSSITVLAERAVTSDDIDRLAVHGIDAWSSDTDLEIVRLIRLAVTVAAGLLTLLVVGMAVALSSAEGRADQATMAAVGAGPWRRRSLGAMHGLFLGAAGVVLGVAVGVPAGAALMQVDGASGVSLPWAEIGAVLLVVPLLAWVAGWVVTSTRLTLVRRTG